MRTFAWDHIHLKSQDPDATARVFTAYLSGQQISRNATPDQLRVIVSLCGLTILIDRSDPAVAPAPTGPVRGLAHVALRTERIDALVADLREGGVEVVVPPHEFRPGLRVAFVRGPEGLMIELLERSGTGPS